MPGDSMTARNQKNEHCNNRNQTKKFSTRQTPNPLANMKNAASNITIDHE